MKYFRYITAVTLAAWTAGSLAEKQKTPSQQPRQGEEIQHVLVTVPMHRSEANTALPVTVLDGDELRRNAAASIGETLASKPGLSSASFGPSVGQPVIRGQQGARVTVLQNSTSSADASNISADHGVNVEPLLAESIEVLRGPSTLLYGGGAIGGVVNVIDKRVPVAVPEKLQTAVELRHGSVNDENTAVVALDGGVGKWAFHLSGVNRDTNNVNIPGRAEVDSVGPDSNAIANTGFESSTYNVGASHVFADGFLGLAVSRIDTEYGIPSDPDHGHEDVRLDIEQMRYDVRADIHNLGSHIENLRWFFTCSDYEHVELEGDEIGTEWSNDSWENRFELIHAPIANWHGVIGVQLKQSDIEAVGEESFIPATEVENYGIFIVEDYHYGDVMFELGARIDSDKLSPEKSTASESFTSASFSTSLLWKISDEWSYGLALSRSDRAPVIEELFSNAGNSFGDYVEHAATGAIEIGSSELDSEQANNVDTTLSYSSSRIDAYLTLFYNDFRDYIYLQNTGTQQAGVDILQYAQEDAKFYGVEFEATAMLFSVGIHEFSLSVFGDSIDGELRSAGDVPRLPPQRLGSRIEVNGGGLSSYVSVVAASKQDEPGVNESETDSYQRWDAGLEYLFEFSDSRELLCFTRVKNIADEEIRNSSSFLRDIAPEAGRSVEFGVRVSF